MRRGIVIAAAATAGIIAAGAGALAVGTAAWRRESGRSVARLRSIGERQATDLAQLERERLPAPVRRYFDYALREPVTARHVHVRWAGEMRLAPDAAWVPFTAEQEFTLNPPGFVWDAAVHMMPFVAVRVRDTYVAGSATMLGRIGGLVTVVNAADAPELAQSALARWLGEAAWFPMALLPRAGVRWEAVDVGSARVVVEDGPTSAAADMHFAPTGELRRMTALRYRDVDGTAELTPFEGVYGDYGSVSGVMVPTSAEVAWLLPEGRFAYWRGRPVAIRYEP
jgi:hypothetical protein